MATRAERKHVATPQAHPDVRQRVDGLPAGAVPRQVAGVKCTSRGADEQVRLLIAVSQGLHHPDLDRTEAAAPGKNERGGHGQCYRGEAWSRRPMRSSPGNAFASRASVRAASSRAKSRTATS